MSRLKLYAIFHLNLAYSSIEEDLRPEVIRSCYWPLLNLIKEYQVPFAIEASGFTLETIASLDPDWISTLKELNKPDLFVGSGYAQCIGPLLPAEVNYWNQDLGMQVYKDLLGFHPEIALVGEMAYSAGIVDGYVHSGYKAIVMEWNNPKKFHPAWQIELKYHPQLALGASGARIPLIWADSIAFQQFQRYVHGELDLEEYLTYIAGHDNGTDRYFPLYANDAEIFDFRPGRYKTEGQRRVREWERIRNLFDTLKQLYTIVPPAAVLAGLSDDRAGQRLHLEAPGQPIPVKKQEKYNINRWALTGRDNLGCNTACYQIYQGMLSANPTRDDWKELCYLWFSDFRTHITTARWAAYQERLQDALRRWRREEILERKDSLPIHAPFKTDGLCITEDARYLTIETGKLACILDKAKGIVFKSLVFKDVCAAPLIGTLPHGYYEDISWAADFFSGHTIIETPGEHKITDLARCEVDMELCERTLLVATELESDGIRFMKTIEIDLVDGYIALGLDIHMPSRMLATIHVLNMTFIPTSFDQASVFFATHLGGEAIETFRIGSGEIHHARGLSALVSAQHGLGTTEGEIIIGDAHKRLIFRHDQSYSALIAHVHFSPMQDEQYFLRLQYSAQEMDDTFREATEPYRIHARIKIEAQGK